MDKNNLIGRCTESSAFTINHRIGSGSIFIISILMSLLVPIFLLAQNKPNIILFISDDHNQRDVGCYGNPDVVTPNIDGLAKEGMRFDRAYAASSMCSPSRSAIFTGLYPFRNGCQMNHQTVNNGVNTLPGELKKLGYRVVISGKVHVAPVQNFPFEYIGEEFGRYEPIENRTDRKNATVNFLRDHFKTRPHEPLCLIVAPWVPHVPWFPNQDFDADKIELPEDLADTKETRNALAAYYQSISRLDEMVGRVLKEIETLNQKQNTVFMFTSDQGAQFPSAKWTTYDVGLHVPLLVRWPGRISPGSHSDALISLVDLMPTMIDIAGGKGGESMDGKSFKDLFEKPEEEHHQYIFAETSVEPHYWYNYTPSRSIITADGYHYIKNYHPGVRFLTHIDRVERNEFYFDSWVEKAIYDKKTKYLLDRYSYRPPEELYKNNTDTYEFRNLSNISQYAGKLDSMRRIFLKELLRQGEDEQSISEGPLPRFFPNSYTIGQNKSAFHLAFDRKQWDPCKLFITAYLDGTDRGGVVCDYFNNFKLYAFKNRIGLVFNNGESFESNTLDVNAGQLIMSLNETGELIVQFAGKVVLQEKLSNDFTKISNGYVTCGRLQGIELKDELQRFEGKIYDLRFTMNDLNQTP